MTDGLRIMLYDSTDTKTVANELKNALPEQADRIDTTVDALDIELGLSTSWWAGGKAYKALRRFDHVAGFGNWDTALDWLNNVGYGQNIAELQYWGHGSPGKLWMNGKILHYNSFNTAYKHSTKLRRLSSRMTSDSLVWLRTCSTFCGEAGHKFAENWAKALGCEVAAHTYCIGLFQSGLHSVSPENPKPTWSVHEGIKEGTPDRPAKCKMSWPWEPRTILCLRDSIPSRWRS